MSEFSEDQLPHEVVAELKRRSAAGVTVPDDLDAVILADARAVLSGCQPRQQQSRFGWRKWSLGMMAVGSLAAALVVTTVSEWAGPKQDPAASRELAGRTGDESRLSDVATVKPMAVPVETQYAGADIDRDGQINILDAFALARQVNNSQSTELSADQNGDGLINSTDVDLIAMSAVTL